MQFDWSRRDVLKASLAGAAGSLLGLTANSVKAQSPGERPKQSEKVTVLNPLGRVPVSFIIDDSTCLVNLGHFCVPQFAEVFPGKYEQDWRKLPREIPDSFVREFGEWCRDKGVKGKYSIVPYPACVGWLDRDLPGWSHQQLQDSLKLVRDFMTVDWDIHPEMISHTWAVNTKTGRPYEARTEQFMENWGFSVGKSTDELTDYISYALRILKNVGLPCEGVTTPGGFGNRVIPQLSQATLAACRDVFQAEIPHYFRFLYTDERSVAPQVEYASDLRGSDPRCSVSIVGCTGDWFGGWDGLTPGNVDQFITADLKSGRMPDVIRRSEPAIMVCHWAGIYYNGERIGFNIFKEVVKRLHERYDNLLWMKLSEIARYWAAKELTEITAAGNKVELFAPFATPRFTLHWKTAGEIKPPRFGVNGSLKPLEEVDGLLKLKSGAWCRHDGGVAVCFDLPKGSSVLET